MLDQNTPLGLMSKYDSTSNTTEVTWSYLQDSEVEYFILEYWDEDEQKYKPFDGRNGYILKER